MPVLPFLVVMCVAGSSYAELVDKVVAVVNNDVITLSELEEAASPLYTSIARRNQNGSILDSLAEARAVTLDNMIDERLVLQKAKEINISVSDQEVDRAFNQMAEEQHLTREVFLSKLEENGFTEKSYRKRLRIQILQSKLVNYDVRAKIVITDDMILDYYDEHYTSRVAEGGYYLLQMGFKWAEGDTPEQTSSNQQKAHDRAERIYNLVKDGQDFKTLAKKFSDLPSAKDGGDLGVFTLDDMESTMRDAIAPLEAGELSAIIETPAGYQFFKVLSGEKQGIVVTASLEAVKEDIRKKLFEEKLRDSFNEWLVKLKESAYIQKL